MRFEIYSQSKEFCNELSGALNRWRSAFCAHPIDIALLSDISGSKSENGSIVFFDVDHFLIDRNISLHKLLPHDFFEQAAVLFICSADRRAAIYSYPLHPSGFLHKPLSASGLESALNSCIAYWITSLKWIEFSAGRRNVKIPLCRLLWAEAGGRTSTLHCSHGVLQVGQPFSELVQRLPNNMFLRCQRSFLVNLKHITGVYGNDFIMSDSELVPIGKTHREAALEKYAGFCTWYNGCDEDVISGI